MHEHRIQISYDTWTILPLWQDNVYLLEKILDLNLMNLQMEQLNACQMYLNVTTLVEIADHIGNWIIPQALCANAQTPPIRLNKISQFTLQWPEVHCLLLACWRLWTKTVC